MAALGDAFNAMPRALPTRTRYSNTRTRAAACERCQGAIPRGDEHERGHRECYWRFTDLILLGVRGPTTAAQVEDLERHQRNKEQLLRIVTDSCTTRDCRQSRHSAQSHSISLAAQLVHGEAEFRTQFQRKQVALDVRPGKFHVRADAECLRKSWAPASNA